MIQRFLQDKLASKIGKGKTLVLMGARQVGKTTLIRSIVQKREGMFWLNGDEADVQVLFENISAARFDAILGKYAIVVLDEAQRVKDIGLKLKLITDELPNIQLIATGSSSFDLANRVNEPLTGRKWEYVLFPLFFKDILIWEQIKKSDKLNAGLVANSWFWRTQQQQEIDYVEERDGQLSAYEFKWNPNANAKPPRSFLTAYPESIFSVVHRENVEEFLLRV